MTTIRARFGTPQKADSMAPTPKPIGRAARQLALAHHTEQLVEAGKLADYAAVARALGLTHARLTQLMNLLLLAPELQHRGLLGEVDASERTLRAASAKTNWQEQLGLWAPTNKGRQS